MVSNASDDLPEPETPVTTVNFSCGISSEMPLRLWTRALRILMESFKVMCVCPLPYGRGSVSGANVTAVRERTDGMYSSIENWTTQPYVKL